MASNPTKPLKMAKMCTVSTLERQFATLYLFHAPTGGGGAHQKGRRGGDIRGGVGWAEMQRGWECGCGQGGCAKTLRAHVALLHISLMRYSHQLAHHDRIDRWSEHTSQGQQKERRPAQQLTYRPSLVTRFKLTLGLTRQKQWVKRCSIVIVSALTKPPLPNRTQTPQNSPEAAPSGPKRTEMYRIASSQGWGLGAGGGGSLLGWAPPPALNLLIFL